MISFLVESLGHRVSCFVDAVRVSLALALDRVTVDFDAISHAIESVFRDFEVQVE